MAFGPTTLKIWPVTPDWSNGVSETLSWGTDVMQASATAVSQHCSYRIGPRRSLSFEVLAEHQERKVVDMLLAGYSGPWQLPVWPDVQWLPASVNAASVAIPCATEGFDFVAGGWALLYSSVNVWQIVQIDTVASDHLGLVSALPSTFAAGSRLYPLRRARVQPGSEERMLDLDLSRRRLAFDIDEPCDWPVLASPTMYLGHPLLDVRPTENDDPTVGYNRLLQTLDYGGALPFVYDFPKRALRVQKTGWTLFSRAEHSWYRSLLYTLAGRRVPMWLPSWTSDLKATATIAGGSKLLTVAWAGYTQFGLGKTNRRDLRIELVDGTVFYRRVSASAEVGANEVLTLDSSLNIASIAPEQILSVSFVALSTLASDDIEIEHVADADGTANSTLGWQAVVPDV